MVRHVEIDVERQQDVGAQQPVGQLAGEADHVEAADGDVVLREARAPEGQPTRQLCIPARGGAADAVSPRGVLVVARQVQPLDRGLGQQRTFGAGIDQQEHRLAQDPPAHEQEVAMRLQRHRRQPHQRTPQLCIFRGGVGRGAARQGERRQDEQDTAHHGLMRTWTAARTADPSASSTVRR